MHDGRLNHTFGIADNLCDLPAAQLARVISGIESREQFGFKVLFKIAIRFPELLLQTVKLFVSHGGVLLALLVRLFVFGAQLISPNKNAGPL